MSRNRMLIGLAVALVVGLLAGRYVYRQLKQATGVGPMKVDHIVVAAAPLPLGTRLRAEQLRLAPWPASDPLPGSFTRIEECVDRALLTPVVESEAILDAKLAPKEAGAGLPAVIPEGMRALSVRVDDVVAVAGFVNPGTMVDVLVTGEVEGGAQGNSITRTILEDVRVLAAGQKVEQDKEGKPQTVSVVTVLVNPDQADKLTMASTEGKIHLALRNTIDTKATNPPPVYRNSLFLGGGGPAPVKPKQRTVPAPSKPQPPPVYVIEVIRGDKRDTQSFPAH